MTAVAERTEISLDEHRRPISRSAAIAQNGINSSGDFRNLMSALMTDVLCDAISPEKANAACNAGGKLLKMVELEYKYGNGASRRHRELPVAFDPSEVVEPVGVEG